MAGRPQTQARDLYDLDLLLAKSPDVAITHAAEVLETAIECAEGVDEDQFRGPVVEFLESDAQSYFAETRGFDELQGRVIRQLEGLRHEVK